MLTIIEPYGLRGAELSTPGGSLPAPSLVEDTDGFRFLLLGDDWALSDHLWASAYAAGVEGILAVLDNDWVALATAEVLRVREADASLADGQWQLLATPSLRALHTTPPPELPEPVAEPFVNLHTHTEYSKLDGLTTVPELVGRAKALGQSAVAMTDHGTCAGHPELQTVCDAAGLQPIFGMEANFVADRTDRSDVHAYWHLCLWAETSDGLRNLWTMATEAERTGFYGRPRLDWDLLERYGEGVLASTGCLGGPLAAHLINDRHEAARVTLARLRAIFQDRLYVELQTNRQPDQIKVNTILARWATELGLPPLATADSHYTHEHEHDLHQAWLRVATAKDIDAELGMFQGDDHYHLRSLAEVTDALDYLSAEVVAEATANTVRLAERCTARVEGQRQTPRFSRRGGHARDVERLRELCEVAWPTRVLDKPTPEATYRARLDRELDLFISKDFAGYMLLIADITTWAKRNGILVGPGRGSGGGSLVAYLLGITEIDPIQYGLLFERFLTEGRDELPDIDLDFPSNRAEELHTYVRKRWGDDQVIRVGTHQRLKNKGVIRKVAASLRESLGLDYAAMEADLRAISLIIDQAEAGTAGLGLTWDELWAQAGEELEPWRVKFPQIFELAGKFVGRLHTYGRHAAGFVISTEGSLLDRLPLRRGDGDDDPMVTQFDLDALAKLWYVKGDLLLLRTLDTVQDTVDLIRERLAHDIGIYGWRDEYTDPMVYELLGQGHTRGVFQLETSEATRLTRQFQPTSIDHLAAIVALNRPGPRNSGMVDVYLRRRRGDEAVTYPDERVKDVLEPTYGVLVYQEQIMQLCQLLAGYTLQEADVVRKILGKKQVERITEEGKRFTSQAVERGMGRAEAEHLWGQMAEFAKYGFNRAHAVEYAVLAYWCAWLKTHYPREFLAAVLSTVDKDRTAEFILECRRLGYKVLAPDINVSKVSFTPEGEGIRFGLGAIKGIGDASSHPLVAGQPYTDWADFWERGLKASDTGVVRLLIEAGAMDSFVPNRRGLLAWLDNEIAPSSTNCTSYQEGEGDGPLPCVFDWGSLPKLMNKANTKPLKNQPGPPGKCTRRCKQYVKREVDPLAIEPFTDEDIRRLERATLGVYVSSTPFDRIDPDDLATCLPASVVTEAEVNTESLIAAVVTEIQLMTDRYERTYARLTLDVQDGTLKPVVWSKNWRQLQADLGEDQLILALVVRNHRGFELTAAKAV